MKVKDRVMKAVEFQKPMEDCTDEEWIVSILKNADYSLQKMHAIMLREAKAPDKPLSVLRCLLRSCVMMVSQNGENNISLH